MPKVFLAVNGTGIQQFMIGKGAIQGQASGGSSGPREAVCFLFSLLSGFIHGFQDGG